MTCRRGREAQARGDRAAVTHLRSRRRACVGHCAHLREARPPSARRNLQSDSHVDHHASLTNGLSRCSCLRSPDASHSLGSVESSQLTEGRGFVAFSAGFLLLFQGNPSSPRPGQDIPERRPAEAIPDQGGFASRLTGDRIRGDSGRFRRVIRRVGDGAGAIILVVGGQLCRAKGRDERHPEDDGGLPDQVLDRVGPKPRRMRE